METRDAAVLCMCQNPASTSYLHDLHERECVEAFLSGCEEIFLSEWALSGTIAHCPSPSNEYLAAFATVDAAVQRALAIRFEMGRLALRLGVRAGARAAIAFGAVLFRPEEHGLYGDTVSLACKLMENAGLCKGEEVNRGDGKLLLSERAASMINAADRARCGRGPSVGIRRLGEFHSLWLPWDEDSETTALRCGRFGLSGELAERENGMVYAGVDPESQAKVEIKTLREVALTDDTVKVLDFSENDEEVYLVTERIEGTSLKSLFDANERFEIGDTVTIMDELCAALASAHEEGLVHRSLSPVNVIFDSNGCIKLSGFARFEGADLEGSGPEEGGILIGTPEILSPEAISGGTIDRRTDIFYAGVILYRLLTGEKPFTGAGAWAIASKILREEPPPASSLNRTLSPLFDAVASKALAKNPQDRYQTATELAVALQSAMSNARPGRTT